MKSPKIFRSIIFSLLLIIALAIVGCGGSTNRSSTGNNGGGSGGGSGSGSNGLIGSGTRPTITSQIPGTISSTDEVTILQVGAWFESTYLEWSPVPNAVGYNVYYKGGAITEWTKIDNQLIREYNNSRWRADILGLVGGTPYNMAVLPVFASGESAASKDTASRGTATPISHVREGYAFDGATTPGAYNSDGTLKENAVVVYVTEINKNTVSLEVNGATSNPCVGLQAILDGYKKGKESRPLCVRLIGNVTDLATMLNGDIVIENKNMTVGITLEGVGDDAVANGWGIRVKNSNYVEIRNIATMNCDSGEGDNIGLQQGNNYIWVHNCDFFYGDAGGDADQAKGDGALDTKKSKHITHSFNHFWDSGKAMLVGNKEGIEDQNYLTFHNNWFDHSDSRHPRVRVATVHIYNNLYDGISKYGIGATMGSSIFAEKNYFRNCKYPMLTSLQGSDVYALGSTRDTEDNPTFTDEAGGTIKAFDNHMEGNYTFIPYGATNIVTNGTTQAASERSSSLDTSRDFDAYVVANRNDLVPDSVKSYSGANVYNNFDTSLYAYTPIAVDEVPDRVRNFAGRLNGGDFQFTFTDDDNASYDVDVALKNKLANYESPLLKIGGIEGDSTPTDPSDPGDDSPGGETGGTPITGSTVVIFDSFISKSTSTINGFTITGSLKSGIASKTYNTVTYTTALKMESSTSITFSLAANSTLVFITDTAAKSIKIDGTKYTTDSDGVLTQSISAGAHTVSKGDGMNLYAIIVQ